MRIFILLIFILSLFSCSNEVIPGEREIHFVSIADDFYNYNGNGRKLENVITDQAALIMWRFLVLNTLVLDICWGSLSEVCLLLHFHF